VARFPDAEELVRPRGSRSVQAIRAGIVPRTSLIQVRDVVSGHERGGGRSSTPVVGRLRGRAPAALYDRSTMRNPGAPQGTDERKDHRKSGTYGNERRGDVEGDWTRPTSRRRRTPPSPPSRTTGAGSETTDGRSRSKRLAAKSKGSTSSATRKVAAGPGRRTKRRSRTPSPPCFYSEPAGGTRSRPQYARAQAKLKEVLPNWSGTPTPQ